MRKKKEVIKIINNLRAIIEIIIDQDPLMTDSSLIDLIRNIREEVRAMIMKKDRDIIKIIRVMIEISKKEDMIENKVDLKMWKREVKIILDRKDIITKVNMKIIIVIINIRIEEIIMIKIKKTVKASLKDQNLANIKREDLLLAINKNSINQREMIKI